MVDSCAECPEWLTKLTILDDGQQNVTFHMPVQFIGAKDPYIDNLRELVLTAQNQDPAILTSTVLNRLQAYLAKLDQDEPTAFDDVAIVIDWLRAIVKTGRQSLAYYEGYDKTIRIVDAITTRPEIRKIRLVQAICSPDGLAFIGVKVHIYTCIMPSDRGMMRGDRVHVLHAHMPLLVRDDDPYYIQTTTPLVFICYID